MMRRVPACVTMRLGLAEALERRPDRVEVALVVQARVRGVEVQASSGTRRMTRPAVAVSVSSNALAPPIRGSG